MNECKRVLWNKKIVIFLLSTMLFNAIVFYREQQTQYESYATEVDVSITGYYKVYNELIQEFNVLSSEELDKKLEEWYSTKQSDISPVEEKIYWMLFNQITYCKEYPEYLSQIQSRAEEMNTVSIFSKPNSFSSKNIEKTANDYKRLEGITLDVVNGDAITSFISFQLSDYIVLMMIMVVAYQLLAERKKGLWDIVHSTRNGRYRLATKRCLIVLVSTVVVCGLVYGVNLLLSFGVYGGKEALHSSLQSIPAFQYCNLELTEQEFLGLYMFIKCGSVFLIGLLIWFILSAISSLPIGMLGLGIFIGIEYTLFYFLPVQSILNILKYVNIFSYIDLKQIFITYLNVNVLSRPMGARTMILSMLPCFILVFCVGCIVVNARKKPKENSSIVAGVTNLLQGITNFILRRLSVMQLELYKILFVKKGILILLIFFVFQYNSIVSGEVFFGKEELYYKNYVERITGPLEAKTYEEIQNIKNTIEAEESKLVELEEQLDKGIISEEEYIMQCNYHGFEKLEYKKIAYERLEKKVERVEETGEQMGIAAWIIPEYGYDYLLGKGSFTKHNSLALLILFIAVMMLANVFVYEKQNQTFMLLRSMRKGREYLYHKKALAGFYIVLTVFIIGYSTELISTSNLYGLENMNAPIQSLEILKDFPFDLSISWFLFFLYCTKFVMLFSCMYIVYLVSMIVNKEENAILINIVLMLPSVLYIIGINSFKVLAISNHISVIHYILEMVHNIGAILPILALIALAMVSRRIGSKIWANR